ncbi:unnamed protein product [Moneuplotes crassus]|uniref:Uncharacterized protein n=1 Tax=Euplotes crassus TaxID=5936 RepID=A0AAD1TYT0_EUPCR|nr:unnamed protein product [Moneuplotes crassus]
MKPKIKTRLSKFKDSIGCNSALVNRKKRNHVFSQKKVPMWKKSLEKRQSISPSKSFRVDPNIEEVLKGLHNQSYALPQLERSRRSVGFTEGMNFSLNRRAIQGKLSISVLGKVGTPKKSQSSCGSRKRKSNSSKISKKAKANKQVFGNIKDGVKFWNRDIPHKPKIPNKTMDLQDKQKRLRDLQKMIIDHKKHQSRREEDERKLNFIKHINKKYKDYKYICFNKNEIKTLDLEHLIKRLVVKTISAKAYAASVKIQKVFRGWKVRKMYLQVQEIRNNAAKKLQKAFKRYRLFTLIPKALKCHKNNKIMMIQRIMRGYKVYSKINKIIREKHMKEAFEYFDALRRVVIQDASAVIIRSFREYKKRKNFNERIEEFRRKRKSEEKSKNKLRYKKQYPTSNFNLNMQDERVSPPKSHESQANIQDALGFKKTSDANENLSTFAKEKNLNSRARKKESSKAIQGYPMPSLSHSSHLKKRVLTVEQKTPNLKNPLLSGSNFFANASKDYDDEMDKNELGLDINLIEATSYKPFDRNGNDDSPSMIFSPESSKNLINPMKMESIKESANDL